MLPSLTHNYLVDMERENIILIEIYILYIYIYIYNISLLCESNTYKMKYHHLSIGDMSGTGNEY